MEITQFVVLLYLTSVFADSLIASKDESNTDKYPFTKIGNKYYLVNTGMKMDWFEAAHVCHAYDSDLATIESVEEMNALSLYLTTNGLSQERFWTSGNDLVEEGKFMSLSNGLAITYANWYDKNPDDFNGEDCVQLLLAGSAFLMNDYSCNSKSYSICEKRRPPKGCDVENYTNIIPKCAPSKLLQTYLQIANTLNCVE